MSLIVPVNWDALNNNNFVNPINVSLPLSLSNNVITFLPSFIQTDSSSTNTGALTIAGGVGIAKSLNVGGNLKLGGVITGYSTIDTTSSSTGSLVIAGGASISKSIISGGGIKLQTTYSSSPATLQKYEEYSTSISFSGAASITTGMKIVQNGWNVTLSLEKAAAVAGATATLVCNSAVPAGFVTSISATGTIIAPMMVQIDSATYNIGTISINSSGNIVIGADVKTPDFNIGSTIGIPATTSISYINQYN
jgi:hypothetical protein